MKNKTPWRLIDAKFIRPRYYIVMNQDTREKKRIYIGDEKTFLKILADGWTK